MSRPTPKAGGFFLVMPIIVGFVWGLSNGHAMQFTLAGTIIGIVLALAIWLLDRGSRRR